MSHITRVVITGIGIISPLGNGKAETLDALRETRSGISTLQLSGPAITATHIAGQVRSLVSDTPEHDRTTTLALVAAEEAAAQAGLERAPVSRERLGCLIGTGLGGSHTLDESYIRLYANNAARLPPLTVPRAMYNAATSAISARFDAAGPAFSIVSACASGTHAIGQAMQWIQLGLADAVLAGGADAPLAYGVVKAWEGLRVLATHDDPTRASRPFSADRNGLVLAEGAAIFLLESAESAERRGAIELGEIVGFGFTNDAGHLTDPGVEGASRAMTLALTGAALDPADVGYINAHGTGTRANDAMEVRAIRVAFGAHAKNLAVSSTKSIHGHAMGAGGAIEAACSLLATNEGFIPATANLDSPDPECDLDFVPEGARTRDVAVFLSNSFGFGGMNAVIAVRTTPGRNRL